MISQATDQVGPFPMAQVAMLGFYPKHAAFCNEPILGFMVRA